MELLLRMFIILRAIKGRTRRRCTRLCLDNGTLSRSILASPKGERATLVEEGANTQNHEWNMAHRINFDWRQRSRVSSFVSAPVGSRVDFQMS